MAKISAHGTEIGRIRFLTYVKVYMSDGAILINRGDGWKLKAKCKPGIKPEDVFKKRKELQDDFMKKHPAYANYRKALHELAGNSKAWKLHAAVQLMPEDADGVWSEVCDGYGDNVHADIEEVAELCRLYQLAVNEAENSGSSVAMSIDKKEGN